MPKDYLTLGLMLLRCIHPKLQIFTVLIVTEI